MLYLNTVVCTLKTRFIVCPTQLVTALVLAGQPIASSGLNCTVSDIEGRAAMFGDTCQHILHLLVVSVCVDCVLWTMNIHGRHVLVRGPLFAFVCL